MASKQVIVMRKDLNMRKGKIAAQAGHASIAFLTNRLRPVGDNYEPFATGLPMTFTCELTPEMVEWITGIFTKVCVYVTSEAELVALHEQALALGLPAYLITDKGLTEFHGVPTVTCLGIGPAKPEDIDKVTGNLPLF